jgi:hypothetical protein
MNKLTVPDDDRIKAARVSYKLKTMDLVVYETEVLIDAHLATAKLSKGARVPSPANVRAAIRRLRTALKPFVHGWVDDKTASLIPPRLDDRLAARARELESMKVRSVKQRLLGIVCQTIAAIVRRYAKANKARIEKRNVREFVAQALDFAGIEYPEARQADLPATENAASTKRGLILPLALAGLIAPPVSILVRPPARRCNNVASLHWPVAE